MFARLRRDIREMLTELRDYRELLFMMTRRDLLLRYRQTVMGFGWAIFMPVINTIVFTVIFRKVAKIETDVPYPVFCVLRAPALEHVRDVSQDGNQLAVQQQDSAHQGVLSARSVSLLDDAGRRGGFHCRPECAGRPDALVSDSPDTRPRCSCRF